MIFDDDTTIFLCSLAIYAILLAPFFSDYSRLASGMDIASARGFAMISIVIVLTAVFLVYEDLLGLRPFKLFQLTKKFLKLKRSRYSFPKLSMIAFAAAGATSLSFILPFYALPFVFLIAVCQVAMSMMDSIHERRTGIFWRLWA